MHIDNKNKDISILDERPTQRLDDTPLTADTINRINFTQPRIKIVLNLHYNESNSFLFVNAKKISIQSKRQYFKSVCIIIKMESKDEFDTDIDIKNCTYYYFDDLVRVRVRDIDFSDILIDQKLYKKKYENILIYNISYKTLAGGKPLRIRFDKTDGFIKINGGIII